MEFIAWPKISSLERYVLEGDLSVFNHPLTLSVKIHGSNTCVRINGTEVIAQSRSRIVTPENDNYGFAAWVKGNEDYFLDQYWDYGMTGEVSIFGEWAGKGIQSKVGTANMERFFYMFPSKKTNIYAFADLNRRIYPHYEIVFDQSWDMSNLAEKLHDICNQIDSECPFYRWMTGKSGVGEGLVVYSYRGEPLFKVKGNSHKVTSKVEKIETEETQDVLRGVSFGDPERLSQIYGSFGGGRVLQPREIPDYIQAVIRDIESEEGEISKRARKIIGNRAVAYLKERMNPNPSPL